MVESGQRAVLDALTPYPVVSTEITGTWDSDYKLIHNVRAAGGPRGAHLDRRARGGDASRLRSNHSEGPGLGDGGTVDLSAGC